MGDSLRSVGSVRGGLSAWEFSFVMVLVWGLGYLAQPHISWGTSQRSRCKSEQLTWSAALEMYQLDHTDAPLEPGSDLGPTLEAGGYLLPRETRARRAGAREPLPCRYRLLPGRGVLCPEHGGVLRNVRFWRDLSNGVLTERLREHSLSPRLLAVIETLESEYSAGRDQQDLVRTTAAQVARVLLVLVFLLLTWERRGLLPGRVLVFFALALLVTHLVLHRSPPGPLDLGAAETGAWMRGAQEASWSHLRADRIGPALAAAGVGDDERWLVEEFRHPPASWGYQRRRGAMARGAFWGGALVLALFLAWDQRGRPGAGEDPGGPEAD